MVELTTFSESPELTVRLVDEIDASEQFVPKVGLRERHNEVQRRGPSENTSA